VAVVEGSGQLNVDTSKDSKHEACSYDIDMTQRGDHKSCSYNIDITQDFLSIIHAVNDWHLHNARSVPDQLGRHYVRRRRTGRPTASRPNHTTVLVGTRPAWLGETVSTWSSV
jgi:hypothetical protein